MGKYETPEDHFDHEHGVLKNKLGILDPEELEFTQKDALVKAYEQLAQDYSETHRFTSEDVRLIHKTFLQDVFDWAGEYRTVDLSSEDIRWCHAEFIDRGMEKFSQLLENLTPFTPELSKKEIVERLAEIHGELIVIHPFRDGNGRTTRLLCDLLLMQSGRKPVESQPFPHKENREKYHKAIKEVWAHKNYDPLTRLFEDLVAE